MQIKNTSLEGVMLIEPKVFGDARGYFFESFNARRFADLTGISAAFVQDNQSRSAKGVLRGLHYQIQQPQGQLVRVIAGEIFDVAVDVRRASRTFGQWCGFTLSAENKCQAWVPAGCAHGFVVVSDYAEILYKTMDYWAPEHERCIRWDDSQLGIKWPIEAPPLLSAKDAQGVAFASAEVFP